MSFPTISAVCEELYRLSARVFADGTAVGKGAVFGIAAVFATRTLERDNCAR